MKPRFQVTKVPTSVRGPRGKKLKAPYSKAKKFGVLGLQGVPSVRP